MLEITENNIKRRGRLMFLLKLIRRNRQNVFNKIFRQEIYTSELVG